MKRERSIDPPRRSMRPGQEGSRRFRPAPTLAPSFLLFLLYVVIWYLQLGTRWPSFGAIRIEFVLGAILGLLSIVIVLTREGTPLIRMSVGRWWLLLIAYMAVMVAASNYPETSWMVFVDRVVKFTMMGVFIYVFVDRPQRLAIFLAMWVLVFTKMGQEGLLGIITGGLYWENQGVLRLHGSTPMYAHPNSFAGTQLGILPFLYYWARELGKTGRLLLLVPAILALIVIVYSGSRTAYLGAIVLIFYVLLREKGLLKTIVASTLLATVALWLIPEQYIGRFQTIGEYDDPSRGSISARRQTLQDAVEIFLDEPMGIGVSAFPEERAVRYYRSQDTHNLYLEIATNLGVVGLLLFAVFIVSIVRTCNGVIESWSSGTEDRARDGPDSPQNSPQWFGLEDRFVVAIAKATQAFIIVRLTLGLFGHDLYEVYWWFAAGLTAALVRISETKGFELHERN